MPGKLIVRLVRVEGLGGLLGKNDIVVKLELGHEEHKSKVYSNAGRSADLDDVFEFSVSHREARREDLEIKVLDKDILDTDELAKGKIDVSDCISQSEATVDLSGRATITLAFTWQPE